MGSAVAAATAWAAASALSTAVQFGGPPVHRHALLPLLLLICQGLRLLKCQLVAEMLRRQRPPRCPEGCLTASAGGCATAEPRGRATPQCLQGSQQSRIKVKEMKVVMSKGRVT